MKSKQTKNRSSSGPESAAQKNSNGASELDALLKSGRRQSRTRRILMVILPLVVIAGGVFGVLKWREGTAEAEIPRYITETVAQGDLVASISATGTVEALNTVEVGAEISGRILSLSADFNDAVSEGQVLAVIDPEQHKASVDQAKAQMLAAQAQVAEAGATLLETKQDAARAQDLAAKGLTSPKELESSKAKAVRAEASLKSAQASAALAKASFTAARSKLAKTEIVCPINGTVLSREVEVGQTLNAGMQTPVLFSIAEDLRTMRLSSRVDEADIGNVQAGQAATFTVDAYPGRTFNSAVTSVRNVPKTDQNVVSYEVLLSVDNRELLLKPGMTASVEIITEKYSDHLLVTNKALRFSPPKESRFRGPTGPGMLFTGGRGGRGGGTKSGREGADKRGESGKRPPGVEGLGKLKGDEAMLWVEDPSAGPGALRPIKVRKIATDGVHTAVESEMLKAGDEVVIEQAASEQGDS